MARGAARRMASPRAVVGRRRPSSRSSARRQPTTGGVWTCGRCGTTPRSAYRAIGAWVRPCRGRRQLRAAGAGGSRAAQAAVSRSRRSSASASPTRARMPARSASSPSDTAFDTVATDVSCVLRLRIASSCSRTPASALLDGAGVHLHRPLAELREGEQAGQPDRGLQVRRIGSARVHDDVDVVAEDVERGDARGGVPGAPRRDRHRGAAVLACLAQLVPHGARRHGAVLGLDHDADVGTARQSRVEGHHEVALLGTSDALPPRSRCGPRGPRSRGPGPRASRGGGPRSPRPWRRIATARRRVPDWPPRWP